MLSPLVLALVLVLKIFWLSVFPLFFIQFSPFYVALSTLNAGTNINSQENKMKMVLTENYRNTNKILFFFVIISQLYSFHSLTLSVSMSPCMPSPCHSFFQSIKNKTKLVFCVDGFQLFLFCFCFFLSVAIDMSDKRQLNK